MFWLVLKLEGRPTGGRFGHCCGSAGNTATAVDDFETETVGEFIALSFVNFDEHVFAGLGRDLALWIDLSPIEYAGVIVKIAAGREEVRFGERLVGLEAAMSWSISRWRVCSDRA